MAQVDSPGERRLEIRRVVDIERARRAARDLTCSLGFGRVDQEMVVLSVSELATNLVRYARDGCLLMRPISNVQGEGVELESRDSGPGIAHPLAETGGDASTGGGLGAGLAGVRRLMHEFELQTSPKGTTVICRKWRGR